MNEYLASWYAVHTGQNFWNNFGLCWGTQFSVQYMLSPENQPALFSWMKLSIDVYIFTCNELISIRNVTRNIWVVETETHFELFTGHSYLARLKPLLSWEIVKRVT